MIKIEQFFLVCATLGPLGYLPASGTWATLAALMLLPVLPATTSWLYGVLIIGSAWCAYDVIKNTLRYFDFVDDDPSQIVLDEVIGCLITFFLVPLSLFTLAAGFILFRFFDITKIGPVGWFERMKGASGIMLDDIMAGILSNIMLHILLLCIR